MIELRNITFGYGNRPLYDQLSLKILDGEFVGIIGPNGAGKTTLLKLMGGMMRPAAGEVWIHGRLLNRYSRMELARLLAFVPQEFHSLYDYTVEEIVLMGRYAYRRAFEPPGERDWRVAEQAMIRTEVGSLRRRRLSHISGGEKQRVVLASALAQEPRVLLLDEPTGALDLKHQIHFYRILREEQRRSGQTIVTVTHDVNLAVRFCERILVLKEGRIVADGPTETVIQQSVLETVYEIPLTIFPHPEDGKPLVTFGRVGHGR